MKGYGAGLAIGILALSLLGLKPKPKYNLNITYDGVKSYFYDYDWRVRAVRARVTTVTIDEKANAWGSIEEYIEWYKRIYIERDYKQFMPELPVFKKDPSFYPDGKGTWVMEYATYRNYGSGSSGWSQNWDYDNTPEFFARQAQGRIDRLIVNGPMIPEDLTNGNYRHYSYEPELKDLAINVTTTNTYEKYAKKDQALDSLVSFIPDLIKNYISANIGVA